MCPLFWWWKYVIAITFYSPTCLGQETAKGPFGHRVKLLPAHLSTTHFGGFSQSLSLLNVKQESWDTNFWSPWFDPTGNRTKVSRFSSRRSIHSTTNRYLVTFTRLQMVFELMPNWPQQPEACAFGSLLLYGIILLSVHFVLVETPEHHKEAMVVLASNLTSLQNGWKIMLKMPPEPNYCPRQFWNLFANRSVVKCRLLKR